MKTWKIDNGDIVLDSVGKIELISGKEKLSQLIKEMLMSEIDNRGFGASLGKSGFGVDTEIYDALDRLKVLQDASEYDRDEDELFGEVVSLSVSEDKVNVSFSLEVLSIKGEKVVV